MKPKINKTWLLIALVIIGNIIIFRLMSKKLEVVVYNQITDSTTQGL